MTFKEIWENFKEVTVTSASDAWDRIKTVCSTTWDLFKDTTIVFITGVYDWLVALFSGIVMVIWNLIKIVAYALYSAILATLNLIFGKLIEWIKKW